MLQSAVIAAVILTATVLIHFYGLRTLTWIVAGSGLRGPRHMLLVIYGVFAIHLVEIVIYALGYGFGDRMLDIGHFVGRNHIDGVEYFFFSAETFTSLGLGDIYPTGSLRLVASMEVLNGLVLIGWSTSFTYLSMRDYWGFKKAYADDTREVRSVPRRRTERSTQS